MWERLSEPWRACAEQAWEAYRAGSLPIGAVVTDARGRILSVGRNRIFERSGEGSALFGNRIAHAEMNALYTFDYDRYDPGDCILYTTCDPCPLCAGAAGMSEISALHYASRDPRAGSARMLETVPYLKRKNVTIIGPRDRDFEMCQIALRVDRHLTIRNGTSPEFFDLWRKGMPEGTRAGERLYRTGRLERLREAGASVVEILEVLGEEVWASADAEECEEAAMDARAESELHDET